MPNFNTLLVSKYYKPSPLQPELWSGSSERPLWLVKRVGNAFLQDLRELCRVRTTRLERVTLQELRRVYLAGTKR